MIRVLSLALLTALTACGPSINPDDYPDPESLWAVSMEAYRQGDWGKAQLGFQRLMFEVGPRDDRQAEARYYVAETQLQQGQRLEAARQFRRVSDDFPRHRLAPDALLRAGDAFAELWKNPELDPTYGETALATYAELMGRYPNSTAAQRAALKIQEINEMFAEKGYKAGVYYLRLRAFDSAIIYFKDVILNYAQTSYAPLSVVKLIEAYDRIGYDDERMEYCTYLSQYYPGTPGAEERCGG